MGFGAGSDRLRRSPVWEVASPSDDTLRDWSGRHLWWTGRTGVTDNWVSGSPRTRDRLGGESRM